MTSTKVEDFLDNDDVIPGQTHLCVTFLTPENVLKKREICNASYFLKHIFENGELSTRLCEEGTYEEIKQRYLTYKEDNRELLDEKYNEEQSFQTNVMGIKVRGAYPNEEDARNRAKKLQKSDKIYHTIVGTMGAWLEVNPNIYNIEDHEHYTDEFNEVSLGDLSKNYSKNKSGRDELMQNMREEHMKKLRKEAERKRQMMEETQSSGGAGMGGFNEDDPWIQRKNEQQQQEEEKKETEESEENH
jgi:hypothetical protein